MDESKKNVLVNHDGSWNALHSIAKSCMESSKHKHREKYDCEEKGDEIGSMLAEQYDEDWLIERAIKEASEFIMYASEGNEHKMFKEFSELCILMKAIAEFIPAAMEEEACETALEYWSKKVKSNDYNPLLDSYNRMNRY